MAGDLCIMSFTAESHYVTRSYLDRFSKDGDVQVYRTLVADERVPTWKGYSSAAIARLRHLYTRVGSGSESDEVEKWFNKEIEDPAHPIIEAVVSGHKLSKSDWRVLARFLAAQDVRTPTYLAKHLKESKKLVPELLNQTLQELKRKSEKIENGSSHASGNEYVEPPFPFRVHTQKNGPETMLVQLEALGGRSSWLYEIQRLLTSTWKMLAEHRWTVIRPAAGMAWFTTDNPVMKLNFSSSAEYNFDGGWGSRGTEIMMPLDPQHLLYTKIGQKPPQRGHQLTQEATLLIKRFIAEHANRFIYAAEVDPVAVRARKRTVDRAAARAEQEAINNFHKIQTEAEWDMLTRPTGLLSKA